MTGTFTFLALLQALGLSLSVESCPDLLLFLPFCLQALAVCNGELFCTIKAVDGNAEVAAALDEEVVLVVSSVKLYAPTPDWMPADALQVAFVSVPSNRGR
eukprot:CAMPEP_0204580744 /NCGR_PEP_ID=MMETSP0661-20131031/44228_1 /ASSEMBLY_ACC=CAM_ASM_000606 /TAXON_ID=109239 /ORGANISM="Alexandrium margalefi, Strain AMGDE01CS-322" /LENGTH=100 /DNA_ID=CAMNT_0051589851 /DNA_START=159 /DNA_END=461 /DNA_ORIENTATION=-